MNLGWLLPTDMLDFSPGSPSRVSEWIGREEVLHCSQISALKNLGKRGNWVAYVVKHPSLDFSSGHDLRVVRSSPELGSTGHGGFLRFSLSHSLHPSSQLVLPLFQQENNFFT